MLGAICLSSLSLPRINQNLKKMKKNLRNVLVLALGLMTTVSFAQDWNVDSRTRIDMSLDEGEKSTNQRVTLGTTWGGSDWGIHLSTDVNYTLKGGNADVDPGVGIYEAYASTNLFGMADMTIGRQALSYGSGALISGRDWSTNRTTWDGMSFDLGLSDIATITLGYASMNGGFSDAINGVDGVDAVAGVTGIAYDAGGDSTGFAINQTTGLVEMTYSPEIEAVDAVDAVAGVDAVTGVDAAATDDIGNMYVNIAGEFSGWSVNVLYMTRTTSDDAATGIDINGELMGASISASLNTDFDGGKMNSYGLAYAVNDDMSVNVGMTTYGETGFSMAGTDMSGGDWSNGQLGYLGANDEDLSYGLSYNMGGISLSASMHSITNSANEDHDRSVTQIGIGYALGDNVSLGLSYATDATEAVTGGAEATDNKYTWITLNVTP